MSQEPRRMLAPWTVEAPLASRHPPARGDGISGGRSDGVPSQVLGTTFAIVAQPPYSNGSAITQSLQLRHQIVKRLTEPVLIALGSRGSRLGVAFAIS